MKLWLLIILMAVITYLLRASHLFLPGERLPRWVRENLDFIPLAILSAIVALNLVVHQGALQWAGSIKYFIAILLVIVISCVTKKSGLAVVAGLLLYVALKYFL